MRYELTDDEWAAIKPFLPNKPRGVPRVNDRRVLNDIFWVLRRVRVARPAGQLRPAPGIWSSGSSTRSRTVVGSQLATTSSRPTTSPSSSWHQYGFGCASMSPRPKLAT
jgi:hypothetical protein